MTLIHGIKRGNYHSIGSTTAGIIDPSHEAPLRRSPAAVAAAAADDQMSEQTASATEAVTLTNMQRVCQPACLACRCWSERCCHTLLLKASASCIIHLMVNWKRICLISTDYCRESWKEFALTRFSAATTCLPDVSGCETHSCCMNPGKRHNHDTATRLSLHLKREQLRSDPIRRRLQTVAAGKKDSRLRDNMSRSCRHMRLHRHTPEPPTPVTGSLIGSPSVLNESDPSAETARLLPFGMWCADFIKRQPDSVDETKLVARGTSTSCAEC